MARLIFLIALANFVLVSCTETSTITSSSSSEIESSSFSNSSSSNDSSDITNNDSNENIYSNEVVNNDSNEVVTDDSNENTDSNEVVTDDSNENTNDDSDDDSNDDSNVDSNDDSDVSDEDDSNGSGDDSGEDTEGDTSELVCDDNEVIDECPVDCPSDYCPKSENEPQSCPKPDPCPEPECKCRFNYRKADNGTCIPTEDCPPFDCSSRPNEEFRACPPTCPSDSCKQASATGRCPIRGRIGTILKCNPKCRCIENFWRQDGICVPYEECPGVCPTNEVYSKCMNAIRRPVNCSQADQVNTCLVKGKGPCQKGCVCQKNYLRGYNGTCVPQDQCDSTKLTCPPNEEVDGCANAICRAQNCTQKGQPVPCPAVSECIENCVCKTNYLRAENGSCIPEDQCPTLTCPPNEEVDGCANAICRAQNCSQKGLPVACPAVSECLSDCVCKTNYLRAENGSCIPEDQCSTLTCPPNEEVDGCANAICRAQKCTQKGLPVACPSVSECLKDCVCKTNYLRDENGTCIPEDQCPAPVCGDDEVLAECSPDCPSDYCPKSDDEDRSCPTPDVCPPPTCKCRFNYRRAENRTCIPTRECPAYNCSRPNEEFNPCPPLCPSDDCSQASPTGGCPRRFGRIGIILPCNPKCRCINNYWRQDGICVPYGDCEGVCPANEVYSECIGGECRALNCSQKDDNIICTDKYDGPCEKGCMCEKGYFRSENGTCVTEDQCQETPVCGDNEVVDKCPVDCPSDYCPKSDDQDQTCVTPAVCPPPTCKCAFNFRRAENGTCIQTTECPPFNCSSRPNEEYSPCPIPCPGENCSQANRKCPFRIGIAVKCNPKCRCTKGHWRQDGVCVPYRECPNICPANEEYSECVNGACRALNCSQKGEQVPCPDLTPESCEKGCMCKKNYLRSENGTCVPEDQCTPTKLECGDNEVEDKCPGKCQSDYCPKSENETQSCPTPDVCPPPACKCGFNYRRAENGTCIPTRECPAFNCSARPNEEYDSCPPLCPSDSCSQASPDGGCPPALGRIGITLTCNPKCRCIKNYWRKDGVCVPYGECPGVCPANEVFSECINAICKPLNCTQKAEIKNCTSDIDGSCERGCVCQDKYLRAENGTCVPEDQCEKPKPVCGDDEVVDDCPSDCPSDYCPKSESDALATCTKPSPCPPAVCKCRFNHRRAENGTCIPTRSCPPFNCTSRPNEEYNPCPALCPSENCSQAKLHGRCPFRIGIVLQCRPKCRCIKDYHRRDGICVPYGECPDICPTNEEYSECINKVNRPVNCSQVGTVFADEYESSDPCEKGCICQKNYLRSNNGTCVPQDQCNTEPNTCPGPNEEYTDCKKTCPSNLCVSIVSKKRCPEPPAPCEAGCDCISGYFRKNATEPCGPVCDCPEMASSIDCQKQGKLKK